MPNYSDRILLLGLVPMLSGCMTVQALEPVIEPPPVFRGHVSVNVEFVTPVGVGLRCADRGALYLGMPGLNSTACADTSLLTIVDPCQTITAGPFARQLCEAKDVKAADSRTALTTNGPHTAQLVMVDLSGDQSGTARLDEQELGFRLNFTAPELVSRLCSLGQSTDLNGASPLACRLGSEIYAANPCSLSEPGWYEKLLCHEIGHVNGWPSSHPKRLDEARLASASSSPEAVAYAAKLAQPTDQRLPSSP